MSDKKMDINITMAGPIYNYNKDPLITYQEVVSEPETTCIPVNEDKYLKMHTPGVVHIGLRMDVALAVKHKVDKYVAELREKELQDLLDARQIWLNRKAQHVTALKLQQEEVANAEEKELNLRDRYNMVKALTDEEFLDYISKYMPLFRKKGDSDDGSII